MKTITKSNGLWTGSLQKHMAVSRREMNKSYGLQQAQLARMNIVRDSQRLQLSAADTLVRLEQLKEEIKKNQYKAPPKVGALENTIVPYGDLYDETVPKSIPNHLKRNIGIVPNSNPALMNALIPYSDLNDEEEHEEKRDPPSLSEQVAAKAKAKAKAKAEAKEVKQALNSMITTVVKEAKAEAKNKGGKKVSVEIPTTPIKKSSKSSPVRSVAPTVGTETDLDYGSPSNMHKAWINAKAQLIKINKNYPDLEIPGYKSLSNINYVKGATDTNLKEMKENIDKINSILVQIRNQFQV